MNSQKLMTLAKQAASCLCRGMLQAARTIMRFMAKYAGYHRAASFLSLAGVAINDARVLLLGGELL